jgi:hypothetical protein
LSEQKKTDLIYLGTCQPTQTEIIEKEFPKIVEKNERQYAFDSKFYFYVNKNDKLSEYSKVHGYHIPLENIMLIVICVGFLEIM